jgi:hypothetical protein
MRLYFFALLSLLACHSDQTGTESAVDTTAFRLDVYLQGSEKALSGRQVQVGVKQAPKAGPSGPDGVWLTFVQLCASSRSKFLDGPLRIVVSEQDITLSDTSVVREACRDAEEPGNIEKLTLTVEDDGTLYHEFGNGPRAWATCYESSSVASCPSSQF